MSVPKNAKKRTSSTGIRFNAMVPMRGKTSKPIFQVECTVFVGLTEQEMVLLAHAENTEKADVLSMTDHKKVSVIRKNSRTADKERTEEMVYKLRNAHSVMNYSF